MSSHNEELARPVGLKGAFVKTVPLRAVGKARPRVTKRGITFMPKEYVNWKKLFATLVGPLPDWALANGENKVVLRVTARFRIPKAASKADKQRLPGMFNSAGSDVDNILGAVMDALWQDDKHIVDGGCCKLYAHDDSLSIYLSRIGKDDTPVDLPGNTGA